MDHSNHASLNPGMVLARLSTTFSRFNKLWQPYAVGWKGVKPSCKNQTNALVWLPGGGGEHPRHLKDQLTGGHIRRKGTRTSGIQ